MCGIAGIVRFGAGAPPVEEEALRAMARALHHRGPDGSGIFLDGAAGLAHTRLAIVDPAGGAQPMRLSERDLSVVFNGEIFNHVELREELRSLGYEPRTRSDTEVVLCAFAAWGDDAVRRFDGQWAIALWDGRRRRLVLTRDPMGILPLAYAERGGEVVFGSEVKALFAGVPALRRGFDPGGLQETFTFWSPIPPRTAFLGVSELRPGTLRAYEAGRVSEHAYAARGPAEPFRGTFDDAIVAVREALERSTSLRMLRADVPVGCYLSGGLDSSLVSALGLAAKGARFHTFSLRFADAEFDETAYQEAVVRALGTEHHQVVVSADDIARVFPDVVRHAERPLLRTAPAPMFLLSALVRAHGTKVVLTGEGADELFAGYDLFREGVIRRFWARQPASTCRPRLLSRLYPYLSRSPVAQRDVALSFFGRDLDRASMPGSTHATRWSTTQALLRLLAPELRPTDPSRIPTDLLERLSPELSGRSPLAQDQAVEIATLLGPYLLSAQGDRMLMAHSVEGRFPFLSPEVARLADELPDRYKLRVLDEKAVLKRVAAPLLPPQVTARKKQPYRAPDAVAFLGPAAAEQVDALLAPASVESAGALHAPAVTALWSKCRRSAGRALSNTDNMALVAAVSTQLLARELAGSA